MEHFNDLDSHIGYVGLRRNWGGDEPFGISAEDRAQHVYVLGKTGTGKTTLLRNLILQDVYAGHGVGVIDPHGDLAKELLDALPSWRADDLVYFDPSDRDFPIGLNLLSGSGAKHAHLVASSIVSVLKSIWSDSWGPRLEYLLYASVSALSECQNVSLLGIQRMLFDVHYRRWVVKQVTDPAVRSFWTREFESYDKRFLAEFIAPVQNKVGQLVMAPPLRNILGQVKSKIDLRFMMDNKRILIANLAKGSLGEDKANLLGSLLVTWFQLAALSRSDLPQSERVPFRLYVDEFHSFTTDSFVSILSEARKYGLHLALSHQHTGQLTRDVREAVFGNVGTTISFRVGENDATILEREFGREYTAATFSGLDNFETCIKTVSDGRSVRPFLARTLAPLVVRGGRADKLVKRSREKYAVSREQVESRIERWSGRAF